MEKVTYVRKINFLDLEPSTMIHAARLRVVSHLYW